MNGLTLRRRMLALAVLAAVTLGAVACLLTGRTLAHVLSIAIPSVPTQNSINILQDHGICVSAGSACAKGHRSHVLTAMKADPKQIDASFRISLSRDTTEEELETLYTVIRDEILPRAR